MIANPRVVDPAIDALSSRQQPHSIPVEQALLGALLVNNEAFHRVSGFLQADHFYEPAHGRIYAAMSRLIGAGRPASTVTLNHFFERDEDLESVGGGQYLARLAASVISVRDAEDYGRTIRDLAVRRGLIDAAEGILATAYQVEDDRPVAEIAEEAEGTIRALAAGASGSVPSVRLGEAARQGLARAERIFQGQEPPGLPTGIAALDGVLHGLKAGHVVVLAGRPSMGKTALAVAIARAAAIELARRQPDGRVLFFSLEMTAEEIAMRALAAEARVPASTLAYHADQEVIANACRAADRLDALPILIDDRAGITAHAIRSTALRRHRERPLGLVVVDHLGLVRPSPEMRRAPRVHQVGDVTGGLKVLAKELGVPVLLLAQLNRDTERRDDKRPTLADLRDSGEIEQDADVVMFIYREEYYLRRRIASATDVNISDLEQQLLRHIGKAEVIVGKNRGGNVPAEPIQMACDLASNRFWDKAGV